MNFGVKIKNHGEIHAEIFYHYKGAVLIKKGGKVTIKII